MLNLSRRPTSGPFQCISRKAQPRPEVMQPLMSSDDTDHRSYWTEQFDAAYRFMFEAILPYPVAECGEPLVPLQQAAAVADVEVQFSSTDRTSTACRGCSTCAMGRSPASLAPRQR